MRYKGVIFDLDGTLLDSMPVWSNISGRYLQSVGRTPSPDLRGKIKTMSLLQSAQLLREQYQLPYTNEEVCQQINDLIEDQYLSFVMLKPHVLDFLQRLRKAGVNMCIATATDRYLVEAALKRLDIAEYFSFIITCSEVGCGKDEAVIFQKALEQLNTQLNETVVFEDALHAIKTAKAAGFTVVGIHDLSAKKDEQEIRSIADRYIYSFKEWEG